MKSAVLEGIRRIGLAEVTTPEIRNPDDVKIRVTTVGVCGSDIHYFTTGRIGSQVVQYPYTVGHECAGVVEEVGGAVTRVKPGDRIAVDPAISCFACDQCLSGRPHTCRKLLFLGCPGQVSGCLSEYLVMPENSCYLLPQALTLTQGALSEPLAIGVYAVHRSVPMRGAKVGILGAGPIGLSVLTSALSEGAQAVYVTDKLDDRLRMAVSAGAAWSGNPDPQDVVADIAAAEPMGLDVAFECCGQQDALDQAVRMLKPGGKLMIVGIPETDRVSFSIDLLRRKEICIQNVRRQEGCVEETLDGMATGRLDVDFMVTHRFRLDQAQEAFDLVAGYDDGVMKAMIDITSVDE